MFIYPFDRSLFKHRDILGKKDLSTVSSTVNNATLPPLTMDGLMDAVRRMQKAEPDKSKIVDRVDAAKDFIDLLTKAVEKKLMTREEDPAAINSLYGVKIIEAQLPADIAAIMRNADGKEIGRIYW